MTTGSAHGLQLRGANLYGERSALVLPLAHPAGVDWLRCGPGVPAPQVLWSELARISVDANPLPGEPPDCAVQIEAPLALLEIALRLCLALLSRFEAQPPAARVLRYDDANGVIAVYCDEPELAAEAWEISAQAIASLMQSRWSFGAAQLDRLVARHARFALGASHRALAPDTLAILRELRMRGLPGERMVEGFGVVQFGHGRFRRRFRGLRLETTGSHALRLASAERALRLMLQRAGLPLAALPADDAPAGEFVVWVVGGQACAVTRTGASGESDAADSAPTGALELARRCAAVLQLDPAPVRIAVAQAAALAVAGILTPARLPGESAPLARQRAIAALADRLTQDIPRQGRVASAWLAAGCEGGHWARCLEAILQHAGHVVGVQLPDTARVAGSSVESEPPERRGGLPAALLDPRVSALVMQVGASAARDRGLGVDCCDVALWRSAARPVALASFPGERIDADALDRVVLGGARAMVVLDGDDPRWPQLRPAVRAPKLCLASRRAPSETILRHLLEGGAAAWIEGAERGGVLVVRDGAREVAAIELAQGAQRSVNEPPPDPARFAIAGPAGGRQFAPEGPSDEALLFAACAAWAMGVAAAALGDAVRAIVARRTAPQLGKVPVEPGGPAPAGKS